MKKLLLLLLLISGSSFSQTEPPILDFTGNVLFVNNSILCSDNTSYEENSESNPWCTLLRAVRGVSDGDRNSPGIPTQAAQAGDIVLVNQGIYDYTGPAFNAPCWNCIFYDSINSGSSQSWIEFRAQGEVILAGNLGGSAGMIGSSSAEYIKWIGFTVNQSLSSYHNGLINVTNNNVVIEGNTVIGEYTVWPHGDDNHPGILLHGHREGVCVSGLSNITIRNNYITGFRGDSGRNDSGMTVYCLGENILIENNTFESNHTGIYGKTNGYDNTNIVIRRNRLSNNTGIAIALQSFSDVKIYQNIIETNNPDNFQNGGYMFFNSIYYLGNDKPHDVYVVNNTIINTFIGISFKSICSLMSNNYVYNNIIVGPHGIGSDSDDCAILPTNEVLFDRNLYSLTSGFNNNDAGGYPEISYSDWQNIHGQDVNSLYGVNPIFIDNNYNLSSTSPAINAGIDILDLDRDGDNTDPINIGARIE